MHYQTVQATENLNTAHTCFVGETLVHTPHGLVPIQDLKIGDEVLSADPVTGQQSHQKVIRCTRTEQQAVIFYSLTIG